VSRTDLGALLDSYLQFPSLSDILNVESNVDRRMWDQQVSRVCQLLPQNVNYYDVPAGVVKYVHCLI
jgi:hypothetical protein